MMLTMLAESALRSLLLGGVVWTGLKLFRVQNPHVHMMSWLMVLLASLSMPLLMHWTTVSITVDAVLVRVPEALWPAGNSLADHLTEWPPLEAGTPVAAHAEGHRAINWLTVASAIYAFVAGMLLLRLMVGLCLTWRLVRAAQPMAEPWTADHRVRVSHVIAGPVTFGSTILLPSHYSDWDLSKRQAVLAHEGAHVANRDFHVLLLASLNRAVFWFSPFAWWQMARLAELAEIISDARALEVVNDKLSYAEILLDLVQRVGRAPAGIEVGLEMARACTIRSRLERILATPTAPAKLSWRRRIWIAAAILPVTIVSAGSIAYRTASSAPTLDGAADASTGLRSPRHIAFYSVGHKSIFTVFREGDDLFGQLSGQRKLRLAAVGDGAYSYPSPTGQITLAVGDGQPPTDLALSWNGRDGRAARIAELSQGVETGARPLDIYVGWYQLTPGRVLSVTRDADQLFVRETGRTKFGVRASGPDAFTGNHDEVAIFLGDGQAEVTQLLLQDALSGGRLAPRISDAKAEAIEKEFARRVAEVPDRFREQAPFPGSKEAILRGIEDLRRGAPNYDRMSPSLAAKIRRQSSELQTTFGALGAVESIFFRGVGPGGYDVYGVKFANGVVEFRVLLGSDGKADDVLFRADGNGELGGIAACSSESNLRARTDTAPVHLTLYNASGTDVRLYKLDAEGNRTALGTVGEDMTFTALTAVGSPWVVVDSSGKCLEIVLPGQRTRYLSVEAAGGDRESRRTAPLAGSEAMLRQYIEALGRGEPSYDRMTSEVAEQTRQQLPFNQAILSRLGTLRAMSFRGVTSMGSDIYMVNFANGTAEWRIGLGKDGTIGRIALGPQ